MAMFPPAPPNNFEMCPSSTSDFFKRLERVFFAQAGNLKDIVRVRVEEDMESEPDEHKPTSRPWHLNGPGPGPSSSFVHSPGQRPSAPLFYPHPATRPAPMSVPVNPSPMFPPLSSHTPTLASNQLPSNLHPPVLHQTTTMTSGLRTPPEDTTPPISYYTEESDELWRSMPSYAERRRAGKHTRRHR